MKSLYNAYQAYERRVIRGELDNTPGIVVNRSAPREPLLAQFGDLLIHTGLRLKRRYAASKPMAWSPMTGSKP
ncbi:MAG: hypothetical protein IMZ73_08960 [Chloroflexi bacterium]|nr:hypothetical protein [Chloroflexota bacterium]